MDTDGDELASLPRSSCPYGKQHLDGSDNVINCRVLQISNDGEEPSLTRSRTRSLRRFAFAKTGDRGVEGLRDPFRDVHRWGEAPSLDSGDGFVGDVGCRSKIRLGEPELLPTTTDGWAQWWLGGSDHGPSLGSPQIRLP
jgi:hypothetical protein